ncbi:MAG: chorismate mutase [Acidobacteria bacterium]|nr:chorismate mutase [Acidobacteriota bacterium]
MDIEDWRKRIDEVDGQLVILLNARSQYAVEIGKIKHSRGLEIYSPAREAEVIEHVTHCNPGPLPDDAIRRLFERIIDEARRLERITMAGDGPQQASFDSPPEPDPQVR